MSKRSLVAWIVAALASLVLLVGGDAEARPRRRPKPRPKPTPAAEKPTPSATKPTGGGRGGTTQPPVPAPAPERVAQQESRIEFDERLVQGQTASGAIYLFQRASSEFRSMVELPESFRGRTVREMLGEEAGNK